VKAREASRQEAWWNGPLARCDGRPARRSGRFRDALIGLSGGGAEARRQVAAEIPCGDRQRALNSYPVCAGCGLGGGRVARRNGPVARSTQTRASSLAHPPRASSSLPARRRRRTPRPRVVDLFAKVLPRRRAVNVCLRVFSGRISGRSRAASR
jgi:hypothetical protein